MRHDLFENVHKGIRKALFEACLALGRAGTDAERADEALRRTRDALRFVVHHGENEDLLLVPLLADAAPDAHARMAAAHARLAADTDALGAALAAAEATRDPAALAALFHRACAFTAAYLDHMREEELELQPLVEAALDDAALVAFGRRSVERTAPADARMMLGYMLPVMTRADGEAFLGRLPPAVADDLRVLIR